MRMGGLQKETAMRLFEGMEITQGDDEVALRYLTVVPFFQVLCPDLLPLYLPAAQVRLTQTICHFGGFTTIHLHSRSLADQI